MTGITRFSVLAVLFALASGATPAGKCTAEDQLLWKDNKEFPTIVQVAGRKSGGNRRLAALVFKKKYGTMTDACIGCHADLVVCGFTHCLSPCMKGNYSVECQTCVEKKCNPKYRACLGYEKPEDLPVPPELNSKML